MYEQTGLGLFIFDENRFVSFISFGSLNILNPNGWLLLRIREARIFSNYDVYFYCSFRRLNKLKYTV
jgi:hypothetical protein